MKQLLFGIIIFSEIIFISCSDMIEDLREKIGTDIVTVVQNSGQTEGGVNYTIAIGSSELNDSNVLFAEEMYTFDYDDGIDIAVSDKYDSYAWYLDGKEKIPVAGNEFKLVIGPEEIEKKNYTLMVVISDNGEVRSDTCLITWRE
ncbi:MAG: hypothetical protein NC041_02025 [Bacteroides sp.]|nr:hypothetical protein [Prevotella sp.]MCM1407620.1 hypothetical protein [Treponema brennaborense]MCM1469230.1 hypothetical protein [Bacteroides sp.]